MEQKTFIQVAFFVTVQILSGSIRLRTILNEILLKNAQIFRFTLRLFRLFSLIFLSLCVVNCASSNVSRTTVADTEKGIQHAKRTLIGLGDNSILERYQNSSQTTKGIVIGGATGALTGSLYSGVGIIPGTLTGMIFGASYGSYIDANTTLADQLMNRGVLIELVGDQVRIILSSSTIFRSCTAQIKPQSYETLYLITDFINDYLTMLVRVKAYTYSSKNCEQNLTLSNEQAMSVAKFLEAAEINTRILYAIGGGATHPIVKESKLNSSSINNRIEITFQHLPG